MNVPFQQFIPWIKQATDPGLFDVQSGEAELTGTSLTVNITALIKNKSFLHFNYYSDSVSRNANINEVMGYIDTTTTLEFERGNSTGTITIKWWVVEFKPDTPITVQHIQGTATSTTEAVAISAVDLAHTFPIVTCLTSASVGTGKAIVKPDFSSTTNLNLNFESINNTEYAAQIIEHDDWDVSVYTDVSGVGTTTENTPITAVTLSETMLFGYSIFTTSGNPTSGEFSKYGFNSTTNILAQKGAAGKAQAYTYYVINTNGQVSCQHDDNETILNTNSTGNTTFTAVTIANTPVKIHNMVNSAGYNNTVNSDPGTEGERIRINSVMSTTTNALTSRGGTTDENKHALSIYDFTNA